jgi:hypothetical protein
VLDAFSEYSSNTRFLFPASNRFGELFRPLYQTDFVAVLQLHSDPQQRYLDLARTSQESGATDLAILALQDLVELYPENPEAAQFLLEARLQEEKRLEEAKTRETIVR